MPADAFEGQVPTVAYAPVDASDLIDAIGMLREYDHAPHRIGGMDVGLHVMPVIDHASFDFFQERPASFISEAGDDRIASESHPVPSEVSLGIVLQLE